MILVRPRIPTSSVSWKKAKIPSLTGDEQIIVCDDNGIVNIWQTLTMNMTLDMPVMEPPSKVEINGNTWSFTIMSGEVTWLEPQPVDDDLMAFIFWLVVSWSLVVLSVSQLVVAL